MRSKMKYDVVQFKKTVKYSTLSKIYFNKFTALLLSHIEMNFAMRKHFVLFLCSLFVATTIFSQLTVINLLTENRSNPIGIDAMQPRFSWQLNGDKRNTMQTAYEIKITSGKKNIWSSGKVNDDSSVHVVYNGSPLESNTK